VEVLSDREYRFYEKQGHGKHVEGQFPQNIDEGGYPRLVVLDGKRFVEGSEDFFIFVFKIIVPAVGIDKRLQGGIEIKLGKKA